MSTLNYAPLGIMAENEIKKFPPGTVTVGFSWSPAPHALVILTGMDEHGEKTIEYIPVLKSLVHGVAMQLLEADEMLQDCHESHEQGAT